MEAPCTRPSSLFRLGLAAGALARVEPCSQCGRGWTARQTLAGQVARCRACGGRIEIAPPEAFKSLWKKKRTPTDRTRALFSIRAQIPSGLLEATVLDLGTGGFQMAALRPLEEGEEVDLHRLYELRDGLWSPVEWGLPIRCRVVWTVRLDPKVSRTGLAFRKLNPDQTDALIALVARQRQRLYPSLSSRRATG